MIYQNTLEFLADRFPKKSELDRFSLTDTQDLYKQLEQEVTREEILAKRNDIRRAFLDHCSDVGGCMVLFRGLDAIGVKITPLETLGEKTSQFFGLIRTLKEAQNGVYATSGREDLLVVDEALCQKLWELVRSHSPAVDGRDAVRRALRKAYGLSGRDAIIFLNRRVYVRLFVEPEKQTYGKVERRFGGLPPEELERLKNEIFKDSVASALQEILNGLLEKELNFSVVTNELYEKGSLLWIQAKIVDHLQGRMDHDREVLEAFAAYLLRENFQMIHEELAQALLEKVMEGDDGAERFIKYYSGDVAVFEGQKYRLPEIIDRTDMRWNFSTIKAVSTQFHRDRAQMESRMEQVQVTQEEFVGLDDLIAKARLELERAKKEQLSVKISVEENGNLLSKLRDALAEARKEAVRKGENEEVKNTIATLNNQLRETTTKDEDLFKARSHTDLQVKECEKQLDALERKKVTLERKLKEEQEKLQIWMKSQQELIDRFETMIDALARALMKKKIKT